MGNQTNHYKNKRYKREKFISKHLYGDGNVIDSFIVDRNHPMGKEVHCVTDTGLIIVYNATSQKLVTKLIARPQQLKNLYQSVNKKVPKYLLDLAYWHNTLHYNEI